MRIAKPSAKSLFIQMRFGAQPIATGTAFVVDTKKGPHLLTNRHNATGRNQKTGQPLSDTGGVPEQIIITHNRRGSLGQWVSRTEPLYVGGNPRWIEHPTLGAKADFVALQLTDVNDVDLFPYDLST